MRYGHPNESFVAASHNVTNKRLHQNSVALMNVKKNFKKRTKMKLLRRREKYIKEIYFFVTFKREW
jgi:hypothetical protein